MSIKKEYVCFAHGAFESSDDEPLCPMGCDTVERAFFTPPAVFHSARTKNIDKTLDSLAKSHRLTDLGPAAMRRKALAAEKSQEAFKEFCARRFGGSDWGAVPAGGTLNAKTKQITGEGAGAASAVAAVGGQTFGTNDQIKALLPERMPVRIRKDPDNLSLPA